jgi:DNA modification methylase
MKISDVVFRNDLYPRIKPNQELINRYSLSVDYLPPIKVNQNSILIDGFHRWKAHELAGMKEIKSEIIETKSEQEIKKLAYQYNSNHGLQLSNDEKKRFAVEMAASMSIEELSSVLSVSKRTIGQWTEARRKDLEEERNRLIIDLYLKAENTQESIAGRLNIPQRTISHVIEIFSKNGNLAEIAKNFTPYLYTIWTQNKQDKETSHFGAFPNIYIENLLYYHTEPFDIVFDPFAGSGTTVDVCQKWYRRYYCSDLVVKPGREQDIKQHDITSDLPDDLPKPDLVFLDPPYWKQAQGKYTSEKTDLSNMTIQEFNNAMRNLLNALTKRKVNRIAIVIQPTHYSNGFMLQDHIFDFHLMMQKNYEIEARYILPYSSQQYNAQMVEKAKEKKQCLVLHRDLVVWKNKEEK